MPGAEEAVGSTRLESAAGRDFSRGMCAVVEIYLAAQGFPGEPNLTRRLSSNPSSPMTPSTNS